MEQWLAQNWFSVLTLIIMALGFVYDIGKRNQKMKTWEESLAETRAAVAETSNLLTKHIEEPDLHVTGSFITMCNERHNSILKDVAETKAGVHRIESILLERQRS